MIPLALSSAPESTHDDRLKPYFGVNCPFYFNDEGALRFSLATSHNPHKTLVVTMPKSGTYLHAALLKQLGLIDTEVHLVQNGFSDYRNRTVAEMRTEHGNYQVKLPVRHALPLIAPGQFAVSHLPATDENRELVQPFSLIFSYRESRQRLVSLMRFWMLENRGNFEDNSWRQIEDGKERMEYFARHRAMYFFDLSRKYAGWIEHSHILPVAYETLMGDFGEAQQLEAVRAIAAKIDVDIDKAKAKTILAESIGKPTKTWMGARTEIERYWSPECERHFIEAGGLALNDAFGYDGKWIRPLY